MEPMGTHGRVGCCGCPVQTGSSIGCFEKKNGAHKEKRLLEPEIAAELATIEDGIGAVSYHNPMVDLVPLSLTACTSHSGQFFASTGVVLCGVYRTPKQEGRACGELEERW